MFAFAALLASATTAIPYIEPTSYACYASKNENNDKAIVITNEAKPELSAKGLRRVQCPEEVSWTPEDAKRQCAFLDHYDFETAFYYIELHGISPKEVCEEGRQAAGLPEIPAKIEE